MRPDKTMMEARSQRELVLGDLERRGCVVRRPTVDPKDPAAYCNNPDPNRYEIAAKRHPEMFKTVWLLCEVHREIETGEYLCVVFYATTLSQVWERQRVDPNLRCGNYMAGMRFEPQALAASICRDVNNWAELEAKRLAAEAKKQETLERAEAALAGARAATEGKLHPWVSIRGLSVNDYCDHGYAALEVVVGCHTDPYDNLAIALTHEAAPTFAIELSSLLKKYRIK